MNQSDRAWYYSPGPKGPIRRCAIVSGEPEIVGDTERVGLTVFPLNSHDLGGVATGIAAVPVRYDYKPGGPVDTAFCTPVAETVLVGTASGIVEADTPPIPPPRVAARKARG